MAETIDSLLISLGLQTDSASFNKGLAEFNSLRRAALGTGAAIGTAVGAPALVSRMAQQRRALAAQAEALGLSADQADRLGFALQQSGGAADNAIGVLQQMRDLRNAAQYGEGELFGAGMFGIDAGPLIQAQDELSALLDLSRQLGGLNETQQARAMDALGFGGTGIQNLLRGGADSFRAQMDRAAELRRLDEENLEVSRELVNATNEFRRALSGLSDEIVTRVAPGMADFAALLTEILGDHQGSIAEFIADGPEEFGRRYGEAAAEAISRWLEERGLNWLNWRPFGQRDTSSDGGATRNSVLRDVEFRRAVANAEREIGAPPGLLWAQIGQESSYDPTAVSSAGARGLAQIMPATERSLEERFGRDLNPFDPMDALMMQQELMRENFEASGDWDEALRKYHGGWDRSAWGPINESYAPSIRGRMENPQSSVSISVGEIRVEGSRDPQATARAVREEIRHLADNAASDHRNPVS